MSREYEPGVTEDVRAERRKERRAMRLDRRKSEVDVLEHVINGGCGVRIPVLRYDRVPRTRRTRRS
jgi:hypothetical protein